MVALSLTLLVQVFLFVCVSVSGGGEGFLLDFPSWAFYLSYFWYIK